MPDVQDRAVAFADLRARVGLVTQDVQLFQASVRDNIAFFNPQVSDTAIRLARFFGTTEQFWLNLQDSYEISKIKAERAQELARIEPLKTSEARA